MTSLSASAPTAALTGVLRVLWLRLALPCALLGCGATATAWAQTPLPHDTPGGTGQWLAHHVRLTGTGMDKALAQVWAMTVQQCKDAGQPVADVPGGNATSAGPIQQLTYDLYYTAQSVTTYKTSETLQLRPDCTATRQTRVEVEVLTREGLCQISPQRRVQRGPCRLPDPGATPTPTPTSTPAANPSAPPTTSASQQWAGQSCQPFEERWAGLNTRYCLMTPPKGPASTSFTPMPASWHRQHPGVVLQLTTWSDADPSLKILDLKATQVQTGLRVSPQVLLPLVKPAGATEPAAGVLDHAR